MSFGKFFKRVIRSETKFLNNEDTSSLRLFSDAAYLVMPTQKQSVATQQLNFKVFKFTTYYVNFPSIYTIVTWIFFH